MNLKNILFVSREGLGKKWWHRLAQVLIFLSTALFAILIGFLLFSGTNFIEHNYTAYSFVAPGTPTELTQYNQKLITDHEKYTSIYTNAKGQEIKCNFISNSNIFFDPFVIFCGNIHTSSDLLALLRQDQTWKDGIDGLIPCDHGGGCLGYSATDNQIVNTLIDNGSLNNIYVKKLSTTLYDKLFEQFGYFLLVTLLWFVFWESIIYRLIIYIIYGKRN